MHELGITRNIVAIVGDHAKGRKVKRVTLEIGKLSAIVPEAIAFCFDVCAKGTMLEGAELEIRPISGRARCRDCGRDVALESLVQRCACGSGRLERLAGEELKIKEYELEAA